LCGALFARSESHRRAEALQLHERESDADIPSVVDKPEPVPAGAV